MRRAPSACRHGGRILSAVGEAQPRRSKENAILCGPIECRDRRRCVGCWTASPLRPCSSPGRYRRRSEPNGSVQRVGLPPPMRAGPSFGLRDGDADGPAFVMSQQYVPDRDGLGVRRCAQVRHRARKIARVPGHGTFTFSGGCRGLRRLKHALTMRRGGPGRHTRKPQPRRHRSAALAPFALGRVARFSGSTSRSPTRRSPSDGLIRRSRSRRSLRRATGRVSRGPAQSRGLRAQAPAGCEEPHAACTGADLRARRRTGLWPHRDGQWAARQLSSQRAWGSVSGPDHRHQGTLCRGIGRSRSAGQHGSRDPVNDALQAARHRLPNRLNPEMPDLRARRVRRDTGSGELRSARCGA